MNSKKYIWAFRALCYKASFAHIGFPSYLGKPMFISNKKKVFFGKRVRVYPGMRVEIVDDNSSISIGNNVSIGQNFHVVSYNDELIIGDNVTIGGNVFITNCDHNYCGENESILENDLIARHTYIGDGCFIGNNSSILCGTTLGRRCVVGANSVVKGHFPDFCVLAGSPAKIIKRIDIKR